MHMHQRTATLSPPASRLSPRPANCFPQYLPTAAPVLLSFSARPGLIGRRARSLL